MEGCNPAGLWDLANENVLGMGSIGGGVFSNSFMSRIWVSSLHRLDVEFERQFCDFLVEDRPSIAA